MYDFNLIEKEFKARYLKELIEEANSHYQRWASEFDEDEDTIKFHREFYLELITYLKNKLEDILI